MVSVCNDLVRQGVADAPVLLPDLPCVRGRLVFLAEPNGGGRIALSTAALSIRAAIHGNDSPRLVASLPSHARLCSHHWDLVGAETAAIRCAELLVALNRHDHPATVEARRAATSATQNVESVVSRVRPRRPRSAFSPREVQAAALALAASGHIDALAGMDAALADTLTAESAKKMEAAARSAARRAAVCARCGAGPPQAGGEKLPSCGRCAAVSVRGGGSDVLPRNPCADARQVLWARVPGRGLEGAQEGLQSGGGSGKVMAASHVTKFVLLLAAKRVSLVPHRQTMNAAQHPCALTPPPPPICQYTKQMRIFKSFCRVGFVSTDDGSLGCAVRWF